MLKLLEISYKYRKVPRNTSEVTKSTLKYQEVPRRTPKYIEVPQITQQSYLIFITFSHMGYEKKFQIYTHDICEDI